VVLRGVDLTLRRGEIKLLLGPSGAGKSSLALTLNGLIPHQLDADVKGRVLVNGTLTTETTLAALTAQVGMLFQDPESQIVTLTVADEVAFGLENLRVPPAEIGPRVAAALRQVGLEGLDATGTEALSGACPYWCWTSQPPTSTPQVRPTSSSCSPASKPPASQC
jgi:energy-coupling factor transporter ATP-binding protein EcfA2